MNEKIIQFAERAAEYAVLNPGEEILESTSETNSVRIPKSFIEEFSKLIVEACAGVTLDYKNDDHYQGWCDHSEEILEQFWNNS